MGDTLVFKTHAPKSAHHAIHVNCVLIGLHLRLVQPDRAGYGNGSMMSENGYKKFVKIIARLHRFRFCSADMTPWLFAWVYWLDYRQVIFVSLFKRRGKLIKLLEVKCETERTTVPVRYWRGGDWAVACAQCCSLYFVACVSVTYYRTLLLGKLSSDTDCPD